MTHAEAAQMAVASQSGHIDPSRVAHVARLSRATREWWAMSRGAYLALWREYGALQKKYEEAQKPCPVCDGIPF